MTRYMNQAQAAAAKKCHKATVHRAVLRGDLRLHVVAATGELRLRRADVDRWTPLPRGWQPGRPRGKKIPEKTPCNKATRGRR